MRRLKFRKLILLIFTVFGLSAYQSNEIVEEFSTPQNFITHSNSRFNFSVGIPDNWDYRVEGTENYKATESREAIPDAGIVINVENDPEQKISLSGQEGTLSWDPAGNAVVEDFVTQTGLKGKKYTSEDQDTISIYYVFDQNQLRDLGYNTRALGGNIHMTKDVYEQNKDTIELIIRSIRLS
ncbi:PsbP-related protein [Paenibacillus agri]|uniref:Uncharacterized protein n=1 Tax=Paenibacillus agri TaxID=2744309 RepID=A0A850EH69_9BACL|nr:PsbP-related protein [Paenibacillus agri]NUU60693.1 hypothetical protein [Paenibacillus agri]